VVTPRAFKNYKQADQEGLYQHFKGDQDALGSD